MINKEIKLIKLEKKFLYKEFEILIHEIIIEDNYLKSLFNVTAKGLEKKLSNDGFILAIVNLLIIDGEPSIHIRKTNDNEGISDFDIHTGQNIGLELKVRKKTKPSKFSQDYIETDQFKRSLSKFDLVSVLFINLDGIYFIGYNSRS